MRIRRYPRYGFLIVVCVFVLVAAPGAIAEHGRASTANGLVFVQTNQATGNQIVVFDRAAGGQLTRAGTYGTGGNGGAARPGTESDTLASQGSLVYDASHRVLIAVNAGSDSVSAFRVRDDRLELAGVVSSGGQFPASIAIHGELVYVLNSGGTGIVSGFRLGQSGLRPLADSGRTLGLTNSSPPFFLESPGQLAFSPDGSKLFVTTKKSGSAIDVFSVGGDGRLSPTPTVNASATPVPFAVTFTGSGRLVVGEAGTSNLTTYSVGSDGTLTDPKSLTDGQTALCWVQRVGDFYYVSNTGSNTLSGFRIAADGQPSLVSASGVVATTAPGPIDLTSPSGSHLLYAETGTTGTVTGYQSNSDGTLTTIGSLSDLPAGIEGIAST